MVLVRPGQESRLPQRDAVQEECGSIQVELLVAMVQKHCAFLVHFHLEASVRLKSYSTWKAQSGRHRGSDP